MADTRLRSVTVNLTCGQPESRLFNVQWPVGGRAVEEHDIRRVVNEGRGRAAAEGREPIHALPLTFSRRRDRSGVADPRGLFCDDADRAAACHRCRHDRAAFARRLHRALRPRHRRTGLGADGRGPGDAGRRRARTRRHRHRHGRRHHRHGGVRRRPAAAHRATADRRRARHQRPRARCCPRRSRMPNG